MKSPKFCIPPYELIGQQCLFFSRPYEPWGITHSWDKVSTAPSLQSSHHHAQAYKNFYDASIFCMERGGFLAEQIKDVKKAQRFCKYLKGKLGCPRFAVSILFLAGSCTPSLIARHGSCYQWSPVDGQETRVPCNTEGLKARFVCQQNE